MYILRRSQQVCVAFRGRGVSTPTNMCASQWPEDKHVRIAKARAFARTELVTLWTCSATTAATVRIPVEDGLQNEC